jgi:tetratricopeptide (TPR) repeat protein
LFYRHAYYPWKINRNLESIAGQIAVGKFEPARDTLQRLLTKGLPPESRGRARELLAQTVLAIVQNLYEAGKLPEAEQYLVAYLKEYGGGKEADALWDRLDMYRVEIAQALEAASQYQAALGRYAAVREDSPYYGRAQQGIRRIWLKSQQEQRRDQNVAQLLQEADHHFRAKRYLTPVNNNAYAVYQAVLAVDPENHTALERIELMKAFYRKYGEAYYNKKDWRKALTYFERYVFMAPNSPDIQQKINLCRAKLTASDSSSLQAGGKSSAPEKSREQVKKLLEESGVESSNIIKFLYEDPGGEKDSEKPW